MDLPEPPEELPGPQIDSKPIVEEEEEVAEDQFRNYDTDPVEDIMMIEEEELVVVEEESIVARFDKEPLIVDSVPGLPAENLDFDGKVNWFLEQLFVDVGIDFDK